MRLWFFLFIFFSATESFSNLNTSIIHFENDRYQESADEFQKLRQKGATIPIAYLEYMAQNHLAQIEAPIRWEESKVQIPEALIKESETFLKVSLIAKKIYNTKEEKSKIPLYGELYKTIISSNNPRAYYHFYNFFFKKADSQNLKKVLNNADFKFFRNNINKQKYMEFIKRNSKKTGVHVISTYIDSDFLKKFNIMVNNIGFNEQFFQCFLEQDERLSFVSLVFFCHNYEITNNCFIDSLLISFQNGSAVFRVKKPVIGFQDKINTYLLLGAIFANKSENDIAKYFFYHGFKALKCDRCTKACLQCSESKTPLDRKILKEIAEIGDSLAQYKYAIMLLDGKGGPKDSEMAKHYFKLAADNGHCESKTEYVVLCLKKLTDPKLINESFQYLQEAADLCCPVAQAHLSLLYREDFGFKDDVKSRFYAQSSANQNYHEGIAHLASLLENGIGGPKDLKLAYTYAEKALSQSSLANYVYANLLWRYDLSQECCALAEKHYLKAMELYKNALLDPAYGALLWDYAEMLMYWKEKSHKKQQDHQEKARKLYKESADLGFADSMAAYALMAGEGYGGEVNLDEMQTYLGKALEKKSENAEFYMAWCHLSGKNGFEKNREKALQIFQKLASLGNRLALINSAIFLYEEKQSDDSKHLEEEMTDEETEIELPDLSTKKIKESTENSLNIQEVDNVQTTEEIYNESSSLTMSEKTESAEKAEEHDCSVEWHEIECQNKERWAQDRLKKAAAKQTMLFPKGTKPQLLPPSLSEKPISYIVKTETRDFITTLYGKSGKKISSFDLDDAKRSFADLGCYVDTVKGKNATFVSYIDDKGVVHKLTFDNPHRDGNSKLYRAIGKFMLRFVMTIGVKPDNLFTKGKKEFLNK